jgi:phage recombination protein Bet
MSDKHELAQQTSQAPALAMDETELLEVLGRSLYPGASKESLMLVLGYCKASALDPMQKPVHIVAMWDGSTRQMRDVIMPGIGLYRTQAARSGEYAGISEPEFGDDVTETIDGCTITFPVSCKVVVSRLLSNGSIAEFSATERWKENYAVKGGQQKSQAPNAMWYKRPYGQLAKCAEAQALRKAFPECGSQPTADEMEGKIIDVTDAVNHSAEQQQEDTPPEFYPDKRFTKNSPVWKAGMKDKTMTLEGIKATLKTKNLELTPDQLKELDEEIIEGTVVENE